MTSTASHKRRQARSRSDATAAADPTSTKRSRNARDHASKTALLAGNSNCTEAPPEDGDEAQGIGVPQKERSKRSGKKFTSLHALQERGTSAADSQQVLDDETEVGTSDPPDDAQRPTDDILGPHTQDQGSQNEELPTNRSLFPTEDTPPAAPAAMDLAGATPEPVAAMDLAGAPPEPVAAMDLAGAPPDPAAAMDLVLPEGMSEAEAEKLRQAYALLQSHKMLPRTGQPRVTVSNRSDRAAPSATSARDPLAGLSRSPMQTRPRNHGLMWDLPDGGDNLAVPEPPPRATSTGSIAAVTQGSNQAGGRTPQSSPAVPLDVTRMVPLPCPSHAPFEQPANVGPVSVPTVPNPRQGQAEAQAQAQAGAVSGRHRQGQAT